MPVNEKTRDALDLKSLNPPPEMPISRIEVQDYTDRDGDPSLRVLVVLEESVDVEKLPAGTVGNMKSRIRDSLREHGVDLFPYIFLAKQSELDDSDDEE